ncbi:MAG: ABC transporter permease subunit [Anaerolineae bacterium]
MANQISEPVSATRPSGRVRALTYVARRILTLGITVVLVSYLTIIIANMGGYVDEVIRADIRFAVGMQVKAGWLRDLPAEEREPLIEAAVLQMEHARGLDQPFALRSLRWLWRGVTLDWGDSRLPPLGLGQQMTRKVRDHIADALPRTLLLFGIANLLVFVLGVAGGLRLSRSPDGALARWVPLLAPLSAAPPWIYGILLAVITFQIPGLRFLSGRLSAWPDRFSWAYLVVVLRHMALPALSIVASKLLQTASIWRSYLLIARQQDHVELATATGLSRGRVERRHVLLPSLGPVLTSLTMVLASLWQEVIILEHFFQVKGVGQLLVRGLRSYDTPLVLGLVVLFAYMSALTMLLLEVTIAIVDPRASIGFQRERSHSPRRASRSAVRPARPEALRRSWGAAWSSLGFRARAKDRFSRALRTLHETARRVWSTLEQVARQPGAALGLAGIGILLTLAFYALIAMPRDRAVVLWRGEREMWYALPKNALPAWIDWLNPGKMAHTIHLDSRDSGVTRIEEITSESSRRVLITYAFDFPYDQYPQDVTVHLGPLGTVRNPHIALIWRTPDGREIDLGGRSARAEDAYRVAQDDRIARRLQTDHPERALFSAEHSPYGTSETAPVKGNYTLELTATLFEPSATFDAELVIYGEVHGIAGTDGRRRDLMVAVLAGTPVALSFGILAALGTTLAGVLLAAVGAWYGGEIDGVIQRLSEMNMILPFLPVSLMIYTLYSKSFWAILGVTVVLSVFGTGLRGYRAMLVDARGFAWIEAAQSQGASTGRIIRRYLLPYLAPVLIPQMIALVPSYVFLEAALAFLGMSDPSMPTWGLLVHDAFSGDVYGGVYHLVLVPAILLLLMAFSFGLLGRSLESVLNPRLMDQ